ncbi:MAG: outer membrane protein assembly factor BamB [Verrucomicrobiales bacterium]|jgi:outer membrane protein assembly factor BamB
MKQSLTFLSLLGGLGLSGGTLLADDWSQWGGTHSRNMVSTEKNIPGPLIKPGDFKKGTEEVDMATTHQLKWVAKVGSQTYGTPTIADGKVFVGTNNEEPRDPNHIGDRGNVMAFDEKTGEYLWQLVVPKLGAGKVSDWEFLGICSSATIVENRGYVVTNRCEIVCFDVEGQKNGNQGMQDEGKYMVAPGEEPAKVGSKDADIIWVYDMRGELGVFPHNVASSSVMVLGDKVIATTSNGVDWSHLNLPAPTAPSLIMLDAKTGKLVAEEVSEISSRVLHCSWASPALAKVDGKDMLIFGAGDGWCYGLDPVPVEEEEDGEKFGVLKEHFRFDANPPEYREVKYPKPKGPNEIVATPVFYKGKVYVLTGQDPEHGEGVGMLSCIDPAKKGDISGKAVWTFKGIERSMSTPAIVDDLLYTCDYRGFAYCFDAMTGEKYWEYDTFGHIWGSALVADGKVFVGTEEGELIVLAAGKELKVIRGEDGDLPAVEFNGPIYASPVVANGVLYVATQSHLYAFSMDAAAAPVKVSAKKE